MPLIDDDDDESIQWVWISEASLGFFLPASTVLPQKDISGFRAREMQ